MSFDLHVSKTLITKAIIPVLNHFTINSIDLKEPTLQLGSTKFSTSSTVPGVAISIVNIWFCINAIHERRWLCHYNRIIPGLRVAAPGIWFAIDFESPWHQKKHCLLPLTINLTNQYVRCTVICSISLSRRRHKMEAFSALLTIRAGNSPVTGEFPSQRPVTRSLDVFFDLHLNNRLGKQWKRRWFEMPSRLLWRHCNDDRVIC